MSSSDGVKTEWLDYSENLYILKYSHCCYTDDEAVERAEQSKLDEDHSHNSHQAVERAEQSKLDEDHSHNSHQFVIWAKTGRESARVWGLIHSCKSFILYLIISNYHITALNPKCKHLRHITVLL